MKRLRAFELEAGYGGWSFGLKKAGIPFEVVGYSEIDKFAIQCYNQNHTRVDSIDKNGNVDGISLIPNYGDCTKINPHELPDFDLMVASPPCQSFSIAGKGKGCDDPRGRIFENNIEIMRVKQPKYAVYENVKGLTTKRHKEYFEYILKLMEEAGYNVFWKILNTKDYGIPQNRERVFIVCFRKDIGCGYFKWPEEQELKIFLKDILEDEVDDKYYLKDEQVQKLLPNQEVSYCIDANYHKGTNVENFIKKRRRQLVQINKPKHSNNRVYSSDGVSPSLNTMQGGNRQPFILIKNATSKGYQEAKPGDGINLEQPNSKTRRERVQPQSIGTLQTNDQRGVVTYDLRIRKLTPTECFRLQGFWGDMKDEIKLKGLSNSQRYKLAGNGVSINVVAKILKGMFNGTI